MKIRSSIQNVRVWEDLLYKEVKNILTATNSNIKMARHFN